MEQREFIEYECVVQDFIFGIVFLLTMIEYGRSAAEIEERYRALVDFWRQQN
jgi:hypothetical protein